MEPSPGAEAAPPSTDDVGAGRTRAPIAREQFGGGHRRRPRIVETPSRDGGTRERCRRDRIRRAGRGTPGAPVGRRPRAQSVRPAGARAELAGLGDRLAGRRSPRRRAGRAGSRSPARSRPTADRRRSSRQTRRNAGPLPADGGLASARAGHTKVGAEGGEFRRSRERAGGADSARGATPPRPERATEHREAAVDDPAPPRPAIRALQDGVFASSRGGHRPHRAPGICTGTARPRRSSFLFIKTTNPGCQVWSERGTKHKHASTAIFPQVPSRSRRERSARHRPFGPPVQSAHIESGTARWPGLRLLRARLARQRRRRDRDDPIDGLTTRR